MSALRVRPVFASLALTLPLSLWALLMFSRYLRTAGAAERVAAVVALTFVTTLIFWMMRTGRTYGPRRVFFVTLAVLFPIGFIAELLAQRGAMTLPLEAMLAGDTPFCHVAIPVLAIPAALTGTVLFPGSILPTPTNPHAIAPMVALWLGGAAVLGGAWCSWGCFFGGLDEGCAALARTRNPRPVDRRWTLFPWAVLAVATILTALTLEPFYCAWVCPFKTVTEFTAPASLRAAVQFAIFAGLFAALVVVLPCRTKKRTQCACFCPLGPVQQLTNLVNVFAVRVDAAKCVGCGRCLPACPTLAIVEGADGRPQVTTRCSRCGACVDACSAGAVRWHVKGTPVSASPETARLLFLYTAWAFATMFGGTIIVGTLATLLRTVV